MKQMKWLAVALAVTTVACKKEAAPAKSPAPAVAKASEAAPLPAAATGTALPAEASAAALPSAASPTVNVIADPPVDPKARPIISVSIKAGAKMDQDLPVMGEAASFKITLREPDGKFLTTPDTLLGGKVLMVVTRADLGWTQVLRADQLSDKTRGTHDFRLVFPFGGIHRVWLLFSWQGKVWTEELAFSVQGKPFVGKELADRETTWTGEGGLGATLKVEPPEPSTCEPVMLATAWTRGGKPTRMTAEPNAPTTWYIAIDAGLGEMVTSDADPKAADPPGAVTESMAVKMGGDLGTAATVKLSRAGKYRILAIATPPGRKAGDKLDTVAAPFVIPVKGETHPDGCGK